MANVRKRISELTALNSASLDTVIVGVDNGTTYKIELDVLADAVSNRVNTLDRDRLQSLESVTSSFETKGRSVVSGSSQLTSSFDTRYVVSGSVVNIPTGSFATTGSNTFTGDITMISSSNLILRGPGDDGISGSGDIIWQDTYGNEMARLWKSADNDRLTVSFTGSHNSYVFGTLIHSLNLKEFGDDHFITTSSFNSYTASQSTSSLVDRLNTIESVSGSWITESETGSFLTSLNGAISSSSQLTSSYDTRYTLSGSVQPLPSNLVSSSAQITAFGFISSSTTINTSSFATTGSNSFSGSQTITGSLIVSAVAVVAGALTIPSASVISLTSGSSISVDASGAITGSLTGSVFGIGDVVVFSASLNSRIISGSSVAGTISGSSQLTSSYDSRYSLSGSVLTSFSSSVDSRLDTLEASIISGSVNYVQVLGNRRTGITTTGVSIISGSITTMGNPVQIMVTGDANPVNVSSWTRLQIYRNETAIGNIVQVENSSNLNVPYCVNVIDTASAGTYTYSMRTVSGISGLFDFGESTGPTLTAVELNTNTNLPSTNNTFTGTNRFNGQVTLGGAGGDEGGELQLATAQTNSTLTAGVVSVDVYRDRLRIFEGGGNSRGVYIDLSKAPAGNAGELMWKASGMVAAGTFVTLDNLKCTVTTSSNRGLSIGAVSTTFEADLSGWYAASVGSAGGSTNNISYTTTASTSLFNWNFIAHGDTAHYHIRDKTNDRFYRVTMMIGTSYISNFISIERLF
jgi:hypothetical protein